MIVGLALLGFAGSLSMVAIAFAGQADWGPPGSDSYATYEVVNRLTGAALLLIAAGPLAARAALRTAGVRGGSTALAVLGLAFVGMATGSAAEFVLFTNDPYSGPGSLGRNLSWTGFLVAGLVALVATVLVGLRLWLDPRADRRIAGVVLAAAPTGIAATLLGGPPFIVLGIVGVSTAGAALASDVRRLGGDLRKPGR